MKALEKKVQEEKDERAERLQRADQLTNSWKLMRMLKSFIKENSPQWEKSKEQKRQEKRILEDRAEQLEKAKMKKKEFEKKMIQKKILETMKLLPRSAQEEIEIKKELKKEKGEKKSRR